MSDTGLKEGKTIRVLHFSSHDENCGVGKYQENYLVGMAQQPGIYNQFFEISPYQTRLMGPAELQGVLDRLARELKDYDALHIQHEFGLFSNAEFRKIVETAKAVHKKVLVTVHTSPDLAEEKPHLRGFGPRSVLAYLRGSRNHDIFIRNHIEPFRRADMLLVHNDFTRDALVKHGVPAKRICKLIHPVYQRPQKQTSTLITKQLRTSPKDVIYCAPGFIYRIKGVEAAIKALKYMPPNYKLAIIGGVHPTSNEIEIYDKLCDLIDRLDLKNRVYITGFVEDDDTMDAMIRECDACVYPYDRVYYAHVSSGALNLSFGNGMPAVAYPTESFKEVAAIADGALILCETFGYYELARELKRINLPKQRELSKAYAKKMAWPKMAKELVKIYEAVTQQ